jgi:hypothetical protein
MMESFIDLQDFFFFFSFLLLLISLFQLLPRRRLAIISIRSVHIVETFYKHRQKLAVRLGIGSVNDVEGSLGALLGSEIGHVAAAEVGLEPLSTIVSMCSRRRNRGRRSSRGTHPGRNGDERESVLGVVQAVLYGEIIEGGLGDLIGREGGPGVCRRKGVGSEGGRADNDQYKQILSPR